MARTAGTILFALMALGSGLGLALAVRAAGGTPPASPSASSLSASHTTAPSARPQLAAATRETLAKAALPEKDIALAVASSDELTVSASEQPAPIIAPAGAGGVPFTSFTLTAGESAVRVESISVERVGPGEDGAFESVALTDEEGEEMGDEKRFDADHRAVLGEPFLIPAHESRTLTLVGNMADDETPYAGQTPLLQLDAVRASSSVSGDLPLRGTAQAVNDTLEIGGAEIVQSSDDPGETQSRYIYDTGVVLSSFRLTADVQEDVLLSSIVWTQSGTAGEDDTANIRAIVSGASYPAKADGRTYTVSFSPAIRIPRGESADIALRGDITAAGVGRTARFDVRDADDITLSGATYGFGVGVDGDDAEPFWPGSTISIQGGTLISVGK